MARREAPGLQVLLHVPVGSLLRHRADGSGPEHLGLPEHLNSVAVGPGLVLAGEVQVNVRHLAAAEAQEGLKGDVEAVLHIPGPAQGAVLVRHVRSAAEGSVSDELTVPALGTAVVGRQGVDLGDAGHVGHQAGANGPPGAHQIAVLQGPLDQLLGGHVHHVVLAQNAPQLHVQPVHDELWRVLPVELVDLVPHQPVQILLRIFQPGREQLPLGQQVKGLHLIRNGPGVGDHHLHGFLRPQVGKLLQHLVSGAEVDGHGGVAVGKLLGVQKDVAIDLVLRVQEVDVSGGAHRLSQLLPQPDHSAVELPQLLLVPDLAVPEHEGVVAQGLDLQVVVEGGDPLQLRPVLVLDHRLEQLPCLAGRAHNQPLPVGDELVLGDDGIALEVLEVGGAHQLVEVFQAHLVFRQQDDVPGPPAGGSPLPQLGHGGVDGLEGVDVQLLLQLPEKVGQEEAAGGGVVAGPVVLEGGQLQMVGHNIQLELVQLRQQVLGQNQRVHVGGIKGEPLRPAPGPDEANVKFRIVGRQGPVPHKGQKIRQGLGRLGRTPEHLVGDAGEGDDLRGEVAARVHEGLESVDDLPLPDNHRADLGDGLLGHLQAGCLDVKGHVLAVKGRVPVPVDGDAVIQVVDKVALHTVDDFDILGGVPRVGEPLDHAVVGNGDGRVTPGLRPLDQIPVRPGLGAEGREGVHVGEGGVGVELHPLHLRPVLAGLVGVGDNMYRADDHVCAVPVQLHIALDLQPHPRLDVLFQLGELLLVHDLAHPHGGIQVGHVKGQKIHPRPPGLPQVGGKHLPRHHHAAHLGVEPGHGLDGPPDGAAHNDLPAGGGALPPCRRLGCGDGLNN